MNKLKIIKDRWKSQKNKYLFIFWIILIIKRKLKIDFWDKCQEKNSLKVDIVIPTISKDHLILEAYLESLKNICHEINNIYIVSSNNDFIINFCNKNNIIFIDEKSVLGYGKESIKYFSEGLDRSGWIFQQLLKLSGDKFVKMENYIIVDSDTILINKHSFFENSKFVFFQNDEWHQPYFDEFERLFNYPTKNKLSFTSHMMIFNTVKLNELKKEIERVHNKPWDKVYLSSINEKELSCISDYDTYANWVLCNYPNAVKCKPLYNKSFNRSDFDSYEKIKLKYDKKLKSVSFHSYVK